MKILIFGCGYLGYRAARLWQARRDEVIAVTRSAARAREWTAQGLTAVVGDVLRPETLPTIPPVDLCLYSVGYDRSAGPGKREVYVHGLGKVLPILKDRMHRLIYVSSTSVYGQSRGEVVHEDSACQPVSEGGRICLEAEQLLRSAFDCDASCSVAVLRLAGIYGPGRLLARRESLLAGTVLTVNPDGWLNLIHADDAARLVVRVGDNLTASTTYLVSDTEPVRRRDFYEHLAQLCGAPPPRFANGDDSLNKRCDSTRIRRAFEFQFDYPTYREGLKHAVTED